MTTEPVSILGPGAQIVAYQCEQAPEASVTAHQTAECPWCRKPLADHELHAFSIGRKAGPRP